MRTDYLSLLTEQSLGIASSITPHIVPLFAPDQPPSSAGTLTDEYNRDMSLLSAQSVQPASQDEQIPVEMLFVGEQPLNPPQLVSHTASPQASLTDILHTSPLHPAPTSTFREPETYAWEQPADDLPYASSPSSATPAAILPAPGQEQEELTDHPLPMQAFAKHDLPLQRPITSPAISPSLPSETTEQSAPEPLTTSAGKHPHPYEQEAAPSMRRFPKEAQPPTPYPPVRIPPESNPEYAGLLNSQHLLHNATPALQNNPVHEFAQTALPSLQQAGTESASTPAALQPEQHISQSAHVSTPIQPSAQPHSGSTIPQKQLPDSPILPAQAVYEAQVHAPSSIHVDVARVLAPSTLSAAPAHQIRPVQIGLYEQADNERIQGMNRPSAKDKMRPHTSSTEPIAPVEAERDMQMDDERNKREKAEQGQYIRVTIGRIEVRATPPPPPAVSRRAPAVRPTFSLQDYLEQRRRGQS